MESRTPKEVLDLAKSVDAAFVDLRFCDLPGIMQHFSMPIHELTEDGFDDGYGFDGSSIRGFQEIQESDMLLIPDPDTAVVDPFREHITLNLNCFVRDPVTGESYSRDPRYVAKKAEDYLKGTGLADTVYFGPEAEFYVFDQVRFDQNQFSGYYFLDSVEGVWGSGREFELDGEPNLGYKPRYKEGYFPVPPMDSYQDLRSEMVRVMEEVGIEIEVQHHEVGTAGQAEIDMRFDTLAIMADKLMLYKYVVKNVARARGKSATFMPKPIFMDNGSGMHVHQSLWKGGEPLFFDEKGYGGISDMARWYIGGLLKHAAAIIAFSNPTTNSFKRLVPGYEAPVYVAWSRRNRSALVRVPLYHPGKEQTTRMELRCPDPACNPYLTFAVLLQAGLEGIEHGYELPEAMEKNLYHLSPEERRRLGIDQLPETLGEAIELTAQSELVLRTLGEHTFNRYIEIKRQEWDDYRVQVTPWELERYLPVL